MNSRSVFSPSRTLPNDLRSPTPLSLKGPPACVQNAMNRERKPFTYTPGGLDLSEIRSEKMAKRLMRNAMSPGVQEKPKPPPFTPTADTPKAVHYFNMPVAVFPCVQIPPNPKELLRKTSGPYSRSESLNDECSTPTKPLDINFNLNLSQNKVTTKKESIKKETSAPVQKPDKLPAVVKLEENRFTSGSPKKELQIPPVVQNIESISTPVKLEESRFTMGSPKKEVQISPISQNVESIPIPVKLEENRFTMRSPMREVQIPPKAQNVESIPAPAKLEESRFTMGLPMKEMQISPKIQSFESIPTPIKIEENRFTVGSPKKELLIPAIVEKIPEDKNPVNTMDYRISELKEVKAPTPIEIVEALTRKLENIQLSNNLALEKLDSTNKIRDLRISPVEDVHKKEEPIDDSLNQSNVCADFTFKSNNLESTFNPATQPLEEPVQKCILPLETIKETDAQEEKDNAQEDEEFEECEVISENITILPKCKIIEDKTLLEYEYYDEVSTSTSSSSSSSSEYDRVHRLAVPDNDIYYESESCQEEDNLMDDNGPMPESELADKIELPYDTLGGDESQNTTESIEINKPAKDSIDEYIEKIENYEISLDAPQMSKRNDTSLTSNSSSVETTESNENVDDLSFDSPKKNDCMPAYKKNHQLAVPSNDDSNSNDNSENVENDDMSFDSPKLSNCMPVYLQCQQTEPTNDDSSSMGNVENIEKDDISFDSPKISDNMPVYKQCDQKVESINDDSSSIGNVENIENDDISFDSPKMSDCAPVYFQCHKVEPLNDDLNSVGNVDSIECNNIPIDKPKMSDCPPEYLMSTQLPVYSVDDHNIENIGNQESLEDVEDRVISPMRRSTEAIKGIGGLDDLPSLNICTKRFSFLRESPSKNEEKTTKQEEDPFSIITGIPPKISLIDRVDNKSKNDGKKQGDVNLPWSQNDSCEKPTLIEPIWSKSLSLNPPLKDEIRAPSPFSKVNDDFWKKDVWDKSANDEQISIKDFLNDPEPAWKKEIREIAMRKAETKEDEEEKVTVEPPWRRELRELSQARESKLSTTNEIVLNQPILESQWKAPNTNFYKPTNVIDKLSIASQPSWSQTLPSKTWQQRSIDSPIKTEVDVSDWKKPSPTKGFVESFIKKQLHRNNVEVRKTPEITVEVVNQSPNYSTPTMPNNGYVYPWESSPESSVAFSPEPRTPTPQSRNSPFTHNINYTSQGYIQPSATSSREYGTLGFQPKKKSILKTCPIQSRSFKYLQLLTGTDDSYEDDEPFIPQPPQHAYPRPGNF